MIVGIGNDLVDVRRIGEAIGRFGARFLGRVFSEAERETAERRASARRESFYATSFAAKEACAKALGTGFRGGVSWRDISGLGKDSGRPFLLLTHGARTRLEALAPARSTARIDVSLTDAFPMAHAVVVISAACGRLRLPHEE